MRIYENIEGTWIQAGADIDGEFPFDTSGRSVSLSNDGSIVAIGCLLYTSPSPRDATLSRMPSSA